jgi:hypothetical protein
MYLFISYNRAEWSVNGIILFHNLGKDRRIRAVSV